MIREKHVFQEILSPAEIEKLAEPSTLMLIYKAIYMCLRILLDIRNQTGKQKIYKKKQSFGNPVIKSNVKIDIKENNETKT